MPKKHRKKPAPGVFFSPLHPTIVFLTVCTRDRARWLSNDEVHQRLVSVWKNADAWLVGRYVLMPDHLHLFCAPGLRTLPLNGWIRYWKGMFSRLHPRKEHRWQSLHWDTRLRRGENYSSKWDYVRHNPVRAGLIADPDDWPYQGEMRELLWW